MGIIIVLRCGAVLGTAIRITAVPLTAASRTATASTAASVFGLSAILGGLCSKKEFNLVLADLQGLGSRCPQ